MLHEIAEDAGYPVSQKTLPSSYFPIAAFDQPADSPNRKTDDDEGLSLAKSIPYIAQVSEPGISEVIRLRDVERTDEAGKRNIPFEQSDEREDERGAGTQQRRDARCMMRDEDFGKVTKDH